MIYYLDKNYKDKAANIKEFHGTIDEFRSKYTNYPYVYESFKDAQNGIEDFELDIEFGPFNYRNKLGMFLVYIPDSTSERGYVAQAVKSILEYYTRMAQKNAYPTPEEAIRGKKTAEEYQKEQNRINHNIKTAQDFERNENFEKWFEGSVIKDGDGNPKIVYHGTSSQFEEFKTDLIFLTDEPELANDYTVKFANRTLDDKTLYVRNKRKYDEVESINDIINKNYTDKSEIYKDIEDCPDLECKIGTEYVDYENKWFFFVKDKQTGRRKYFGEWDSPNDIQDWLKNLHNGGLQAFYLNFKNPYIMDAHGKSWENLHYEGKSGFIDEFAEEIRERGYDGIIVKNCSDGNYRTATEYIAYSSNQLKSVLNNGSYDTNKMNFYENKDMAKTIRLTESDLHNIIKESVINVLKEYHTEDAENLEVYNDYFEPDVYGDYDIRREDFPEGKEGDNAYSWALKNRRDTVAKIGKPKYEPHRAEHANKNVRKNSYFSPATLYAKHGDNEIAMNQYKNWK